MRESCMHKIKRNTRGAAMLIALLVFFLAAFSGTIALTMAASNAGRYTHEKDDHQAYLSVMSAGNLILDRLKGITVIYRGTTKGQVPSKDNEVNIIYSISEEDLFLADENFKKMLRLIALPGSPELEEPVVFTLSPDGHSEMGTVSVSVSISGKDLKFALYHVNGNARNYQMRLDVGCSLEDGYYNSQTKPGYYERTMTFATESATYTYTKEKEKDVSSGGTTE